MCFNWVRAVLWKTSLVARCRMNRKVQVTYKERGCNSPAGHSIGVWPASSGLGFVMPVKYKVGRWQWKGEDFKGFVETCLLQLSTSFRGNRGHNDGMFWRFQSWVRR